ncbi:MAG: hypothetical protein M1825_004515 [Sarcosagium campestre]|nr:MAG: hypothetical protein M1825_004515 [Sarcosagium campestre]
MAASRPEPSFQPPPSESTAARQTSAVELLQWRRRQQQQQQPQGACNYKILAVGDAAAPRCGCQRFWPDRASKTQDGGPGNAQGATLGEWCMCAHHLCYHESGVIGGPITPDAASFSVGAPIMPDVATRAYARPTQLHGQGGHTEVTMLPLPSFSAGLNNMFEGGNYSLNSPNYASTSCLPPVAQHCIPTTQEPNLGMSERAHWLPRSAAGDQCDSPNQQQKASYEAYRQRSDIKVHKSRANAQGTTSNQYGLEIPDVSQAPIEPGDVIQSATEAATPSETHSPNLQHLTFDGSVGQTKTLLDQLESTMERCSQASRSDADNRKSANAVIRMLVPHLHLLAKHISSYPTLASSLQSHAMRIESLENASLSNGPFEEINEKFDVFDGRVTEVEGRLEEAERLRRDADEDGTSTNGQDSFRSTTSSALVAAAIDNVGIRARMKTVENRVTKLESFATPCIDRPWQVEVVVLPWGRHLKGIWTSAQEFLGPDSNARDEGWFRRLEGSGWLESDCSVDAADPLEGSAYSTTAASGGGDGGGGWNGAAIRRWAHGTQSWMSPKACAPHGKVYKRLASRGMVQTVSIYGGSARDVGSAIEEAFGDILETLCDHVALPQRADNRPLGLLSPYIPLRKVHKESRLRFLNPDEMISTTLWDAKFLASSVVMKGPSGQNRLYVTHRDGYLQYNRSAADWSWERLQQLPRVESSLACASSTRDGSILGRDDIDVEDEAAYWSWDARLDASQASVEQSSDKPSQHTPLSFRLSQMTCSPPAPASEMAASWSLESSESSQAAGPQPISPLSEAPPVQQTTTMTTTTTMNTTSASKEKEKVRCVTSAGPGAAESVRISSVDAKRRIASESMSMSHTHRVPPLSKRRRISHSPAAPDGPGPSTAGIPTWAFTPRYSSPGSGSVADGQSSQLTSGASSNDRGNTPMAYATPHSGFVSRPRRRSTRDGDGDDDSVDWSERASQPDGEGDVDIAGDGTWQGVTPSGDESGDTTAADVDDGDDDDDDDDNDADEEAGEDEELDDDDGDSSFDAFGTDVDADVDDEAFGL